MVALSLIAAPAAPAVPLPRLPDRPPRRGLRLLAAPTASLLLTAARQCRGPSKLARRATYEPVPQSLDWEVEDDEPDPEEEAERSEFAEMLQDEGMRRHLEAAVEAAEDKQVRTVLRLTFGMDRNWKPRNMQEVGNFLGGTYRREVAMKYLMDRAMRAVPIMEDDPKNLRVLYEDEEVLAVHKPAGMPTTPFQRWGNGSVMNLLQGYCKLRGFKPPQLVHNLDDDTSGVLLYAKNWEAKRALVADWLSPKCVKEYMAIGLKREGTEHLDVGHDVVCTAEMAMADEEGERWRMVPRGGRRACTDVKVLAAGERAVLLGCRLDGTDLPHQVRVHAKTLGVPLLGDKLYGGVPRTNAQKKAAAGLPAAGRTALHLWRLQVPHPGTRKPLRIQSPPPADMRGWAQALGLRKPREGQRAAGEEERPPNPAPKGLGASDRRDLPPSAHD